ncbi:hypothetical protein [Gluconacetobacter tumulisoli]|uniref:Capsule biosynthesis protein n=1 Tax=Gluconacetobacter tumulisoli TaxID=1286189 RepID=A0A7W4K667_9PROT|nr:hypothetical protein [Gluconacetobacter tumulisoli]MBB2201124.1 hypothetical protein [Gluconacetobacter tumulisoli]
MLERLNEDEDDFEFEVRAVRPYVHPTVQQRRRQRIRSIIISAIILCVPTLVGALYLFVFSSNVYATNSIVMVRVPLFGQSSGSSGGGGGAMAALMGGGGGGSSATPTTRAIDESYAVVQYIQSEEAFRQVEREIGFRKLMSQPGVDWLHRLSPHASFRWAYRYYLRHVHVYYDDFQGQILLSTYAFTPETSLAIANALTHASEHLVNRFNDQAAQDYLAVARQQVVEKKREWDQASEALMNFRLANDVIDPALSSTSYNNVIMTLVGQAASLRAQIAAVGKLGEPVGQVGPLRNQLTALEQEIDRQQTRLTGHNDALARTIAGFSTLTTAQSIAQQEYVSALSTLDTELFTIKRQMLYIVNVVPPRAPEEAQYPQRWKDLAIILVLSFCAWLTVRIVVAALKDHLT